MVAAVFIIIIGLSTQLFSQDEWIAKYFDLPDDKKEILESLSEYTFRDIPNFSEEIRNNILNEYPYNMESLLMLGEYHYRNTGDLEETRRQFYRLNYFLKQLELNSPLPDKYQIEYIKIRDQLSYIETEMDANFSNLYFSIRDVHIPRFSYLHGGRMIIQIPDAVKNAAGKEQRLRLENIEESYSSGDRMIYFTHYDSIRNNIYFTIPDFPIVFYRTAAPYVLIVNNNKRYHFDFKADTGPIEIDWDDQWQLVETVPENEIKLEFSRKQVLAVNTDVLLLNGMSDYRTDFENEEYANLFIKMQNNEKIDIHLNSDYKGRHFEKGLRWLTMAAYGLSVYYMINEVKDQEYINGK